MHIKDQGSMIILILFFLRFWFNPRRFYLYCRFQVDENILKIQLHLSISFSKKSHNIIGKVLERSRDLRSTAFSICTIIDMTFILSIHNCGG